MPSAFGILFCPSPRGGCKQFNLTDNTTIYADYQRRASLHSNLTNKYKVQDVFYKYFN